MMLTSTPDEIDRVTSYFESQAPDLKIEFLQKVYIELVLNQRHEVWDIHTNEDRWWVITNPMNLYSQEQFPNMDLAVTFHVGLCLRVPRSELQKLSALPIEPFAECFRALSEAVEALSHAEEVGDYQALGVRCRETLLAFADAAQAVLPWNSADQEPRRADFKAWMDHVCLKVLAGPTHEHRRHLLKTLLDSTWKFVNWLTHAKSSRWHDAEAAVTSTEHAIDLAVSVVIRHLRGVPEACPACGSHRLSPQRGFNEEIPDLEWERPTCERCDWTGAPVPISKVPVPPDEGGRVPPEGECVIPTVPLRVLKKPSTSKR